MIKKKRGLTLIELLAVIAIITILFVMLVPQISSAIEKSRETGLQTDLRDYQTGISGYFMENGRLPEAEAELNKNLDKNLRFEGGKSKEKNPWGTAYKLKLEDDELNIESTDKKGILHQLSARKTEENTLDFDVAKKENKKQETTNPSYFVVKDVAGGVEIIDYATEGPKDVVIPEEIDGKNVVGIADVTEERYIFAAKEITSVVLPETMKYIGFGAFMDNEIKEIHLPYSMETIRQYAFAQNEISELKLPNNVKEVDMAAFFQNKIEKLTLSNKMMEITSMAFSDNLIKEVSFPDNITSIRNSAFLKNSIEKLTIGGNIKLIETTAFSNNNITELILSEGVEEIGFAAFSSNNLEEVTLPSTIKKLKTMIFSSNPNFKKVTNLSPLDVRQYFESNIEIN